jgi:hypothetical protein
MSDLAEALQKFARTTLDLGLKRQATRLFDRINRTPIEEVLNRVPGGTIAARSAVCGVSRQTYYKWLAGVRPTIKHAAKLQEITGFTVAQIRGDSPKI